MAQFAELPDGTRLEFPDDASPQVIQSVVKRHLGVANQPDQALEKPQNQSWGDVAGSALVNAPSSIGNLIGGVAKSVIHPVDTATNLGKLVVGAGESMTGKIAQAINPEWTAPPTEREQMANQVGDFYKDRYGSEEGLKRALSTDPAGVAADAATVLSGGAALASNAPKLAKIAEALRATSSAIDPLANTVRVLGKGANLAGKGVSAALGMTSGMGSEVPSQLYRAGKVGGAAQASALENMRGNVPMTSVLDDVNANLAEMGKAKLADYRANMKAVNEIKKPLSFSGIDKALVDAVDKVLYKGVSINPKATAAVQEVQKLIEEWKSLDPAEFHTPEGMDKLKQAVNGIKETIPYEQRTALSGINEIYHAIKKEIIKQAPEYSKAMEDYQQASELMNEIKSTLSNKPNASIDTQMRKLQSLMRNNVNTNYGNRLDLVKQMEQKGGTEIIPAIAGQAASSWTPRGIQSATTIPAAIGAAGFGGMGAGAAMLPLASPRVVGEASLKAGQIARLLKSPVNSKAGQAIIQAGRESGIDPKIIANLLYQAQQPKGVSK